MNVRPTVLLSVIRKILTIILIHRTGNCMKEAISRSQATYQKDKSTTELVFSLKTMTQKAISTDNYNIWITLMDMLKAFDSVSRKKLFEY